MPPERLWCNVYSIGAPAVKLNSVGGLTVYCIQRRRAEVVTEHLRYVYAVQLKRICAPTLLLSPSQYCILTQPVGMASKFTKDS